VTTRQGDAPSRRSRGPQQWALSLSLYFFSRDLVKPVKGSPPHVTLTRVACACKKQASMRRVHVQVEDQSQARRHDLFEGGGGGAAAVAAREEEEQPRVFLEDEEENEGDVRTEKLRAVKKRAWGRDGGRGGGAATASAAAKTSPQKKRHKPSAPGAGRSWGGAERRGGNSAEAAEEELEQGAVGA
jgi:hypothetical protein